MLSGDSMGELKEQAVVYLEIDSDQPLTPQLVASVEEVCDRVEDATDSPVVVVRLGAGADGGARPGPGGVPIHLVNKWERALRRMERLRAATIAVAEGRCSGPAIEALLSCDYRIGGRELRLRLPFVAGEPWPGMLVYRLANQLGVARARGLVLFGNEISAQRAAEIGLVDEITDDVAKAVAEQIALVRDLVGTELAIRRRLLLEAGATSFEDALGTHLAACDRALRRTGHSTRQSAAL